MRNRFKSIIKTDRYGVRYVKNFTIWADGSVSLQRWDGINTEIVTKRLKNKEA